MKKLIGYILGVLLLALVVAMLFFASAVYDTRARESIQTHFFQTNELSVMRPGAPVRESDIGETAMREMLIKKYVTEYFYAVPDKEDVARRDTRRSVLARMSGAAALEYWRQNELPEIESLAASGARRTVTVFNEIYRPAASNYWRVDYELKTWYKPNDMSESPKITRGTMYLDLGDDDWVNSIGDIKQPIEDVQAALKNGIDPALVFVFNVQRVLVEEK